MGAQASTGVRGRMGRFSGCSAVGRTQKAQTQKVWGLGGAAHSLVVCVAKQGQEERQTQLGGGGEALLAAATRSTIKRGTIKRGTSVGNGEQGGGEKSEGERRCGGNGGWANRAAPPKSTPTQWAPGVWRGGMEEEGGGGGRRACVAGLWQCEKEVTAGCVLQARATAFVISCAPPLRWRGPFRGNGGRY